MANWIPGNPLLKLPVRRSQAISNALPVLFTYERYAILQFLNYLETETARPIQTILMPNFMCHEVPKALQEAGYQIVYYPLTAQLEVDLGQFQAAIDQAATVPDVCFVYHAYGKLVHNISELALICERQSILFLEDCAHLPYPYRANLSETLSAAQFYSLRKTYVVPQGALILSCEHEVGLSTFLKKQKLPVDHSWLRLTKWFLRQLLKNIFIKLGLPYKKSYADLSNEPLSLAQTCLRAIESLVSRDDSASVIKSRRSNYKNFIHNQEVFKGWATPLDFNVATDVPYQFLLFINEGLDPVDVVNFFRDRSVAAMLGMALSNEILNQLPKEHVFQRQVALPLHQDINEQQIKRMIAVAREFQEFQKNKKDPVLAKQDP